MRLLATIRFVACSLGRWLFRAVFVSSWSLCRALLRAAGFGFETVSNLARSRDAATVQGGDDPDLY